MCDRSGSEAEIRTLGDGWRVSLCQESLVTYGGVSLRQGPFGDRLMSEPKLSALGDRCGREPERRTLCDRLGSEP